MGIRVDRFLADVGGAAVLAADAAAGFAAVGTNKRQILSASMHHMTDGVTQQSLPKAQQRGLIDEGGLDLEHPKLTEMPLCLQQRPCKQ